MRGNARSELPQKVKLKGRNNIKAAYQNIMLGATALQRATIPRCGVQRRNVAPTAAHIIATVRPYGVDVLSNERIVSSTVGLSFGGKIESREIRPPCSRC